jgi:hypothetical protein
MLNVKPLALNLYTTSLSKYQEDRFREEFRKMDLELTNGHQIEKSNPRTQKNHLKKKFEKFSEGIKKWEPKRLGQLLSYRPLCRFLIFW